MKERKLQGFVYRNLHFKDRVVYSIRDTKGITIAHSECILIRHAKFVVQEKGRDKVRRNKQKNVHAGVKGEIVIDPFQASYITTNSIKQHDNIIAYYNPYETDSFIDINTKEKLLKADYVLLTSNNGKSRVHYVPYGSLFDIDIA